MMITESRPTGLVDEWRPLLAAHARSVRFAPQTRIFAEGAAADRFWLLERGLVALDSHLPGRGSVVVETVHGGDVLGLSWSCPSRPRRFGAVAWERTEALEVDADTCRKLFEEDPLLGYTVVSELMAATVDRLQAARLRLLDPYREGVSGGAGGAGPALPG
jgi:CRP-like cAMP-binding protein